MHLSRVRVFACIVLIALIGSATNATAQGLDKIGELELTLNGLVATVSPTNPVIPKNTGGGVRVVINAGSGPLSASQAATYFGGAVRAQAELSGPGLSQTITIPDESTATNDPLLIQFPPLATAGEYTLSNIRLMANGATALNVSPGTIPVRIIDEVLVTSVETHPMTLEEIQEAGIVLDDSSYQGFQFTIALVLESQVVNLSFPVVFDSDGVAVPQPLHPPSDPIRDAVDVPIPQLVPVMLETSDGSGGGFGALPELVAAGVKIPGILVIPGSVGYLKQFFSADLYVANGSPAGSNLVVREITGKINLPPGDDAVLGNGDDPLTLPNTNNGPQPVTKPIVGSGSYPDLFNPGDSGKADWSIRGEKEGFQPLTFDIKGTLEGLITGPVTISGVASGGVLVRNPYFDMSFTVPSVVRKGERFTLYVTVTNISMATANNITVALNRAQMSGLVLLGDPSQSITTLKPRDAKTLSFLFEAQRTGKVVASYLRLETQDGSTGQLNFTIGVGERGVPLSPDTLVLPAAVGNLPADVVDAAMRVLGQAWSIANAPAGTLPAGVVRVSKTVATQKALALAEAGLRVKLGQSEDDAVRDLITDFYGVPVDRGFDQLLRETDAGKDFARVLGVHLAEPAANAGGALNYFREYAGLLASGPDAISFAISGGGDESPVSVEFTDGAGQRLTAAESKVAGGVLIPVSGPGVSASLGMMTSTVAWPYTLTLTGTTDGTADIAFAMPNGDGRLIFGRADGVSVRPDEKMKVVFDIFNPSGITLRRDSARDGTFAETVPVSFDTISPEGPQFISAAVIGPETLDGAAPYGKNLAILFDRQVDPASASSTANYTISKNSILGAKPQLSGRVVFANMAQPEGPYVPAELSVAGVADKRLAVGRGGRVALQSLLQAPGAVVTGRVFNSDGSIASSAKITYSNEADDPTCQFFMRDSLVGVAQTSLASDGRYEFRYVWQSRCGGNFQIATNDPSSGALRSVMQNVDAPGQRIFLDLVMMGRGTVTGTVRDLHGRPVYGAKVTAVSVTDPQIGGTGTTDVDGVYTISGMTVGTVSVTAAKGTSLGHSTGEILRAGTAGVIDINLDGGVVSASGVVTRLENGVSSVLAGVPVAYYVKMPGPYGNLTPVGAATSGPDGKFAISGVPTGEYVIRAYLNSRDFAQMTGTAAAGDELKNLNLVIQVNEASFGTVEGTVYLSTGAPAGPDVIVYSGTTWTLTQADGAYRLSGLQVKPLVSQTVSAMTKDRIRSGYTHVILDTPSQSISGADITLSGIGDATFTVVDGTGQPIPGVEVAIMSGYCASMCGCNQQTTSADGKVTFAQLGLGSTMAKALRRGVTSIDVATGTATILRDGTTAFGVLQFLGEGIVTGKVLDPDGRPVHGASVELSAKSFNPDECDLLNGLAQVTRTNQAGQFEFRNVKIGPVGVSVSSPFYPTKVGAKGVLNANGDVRDFTLRLVDTISGTLSGTVYLPNGTTPAGAGVQVTASGVLPDVTVTTNGQGHFEFAKIFPEGKYTLTASDPVTGLVVQESLYLRASQDTLRNLRLKGRGSVTVRVVDGADQPVGDAIVTLQEDSFPNQRFDGAIEASSHGVITFDDVFEGPIDIKVVDVHSRGGRASAVLPQGTSSINVKVQLTTTGTVQGHFYMPDRTTPVPYGVIRLLAGGKLIGQVLAEGTGDTGAYSFDYVPAGPVRIEAQDPDTARTGVAAGVIEAEGDVLDLNVYAQALGTVQGTVMSNGSPQPGAEVTLKSGQYSAGTSTDASGQYRIVGVPEGVVHASASIDEGFLQGTSSAPLAGEGSTLTLDVALRSSGQISGRVLNHDRTPAPPSLVTVRMGGIGGGTMSVTSDQEGNFFFHRVPSGAGTITAQVLGRVDQAKTAVEVPDAGTATVDVVLNGVGAIQGQALDSAGNPTAGTVVLNGTDPFPYSVTLKLGNDGKFTVPEVLAEDFTASLRVQANGFTLYGSRSGTVSAGQTTQLTIQVEPTGTITGHVLRPDGTSPAIGAEVKVVLGSVSTNYQVQNDGTFTAVGVPLGPFTVRINDVLTNGLGLVSGHSLQSNGETVDLGTVVLDNTSLAVESITPADGSSAVGIQQAITIVFSDAVDSTGSIYVREGTRDIYLSRALSSDGKTVTLQGTLPDSAEVTVLVTTGVHDVYGRALLQPVTATFHTVDLTPPRVTAIAPLNATIQVLPESRVTVAFSEPLDTSANLQNLISVTSSGAPVPGISQQVAPDTVVFTPSAPLLTDSAYAVTVANATDISGNVQRNPFTSTFLTLDTVRPSLVLTSPADGSFTNSSRPTIRVSLSDSLTGIDSQSATLRVDGGLVNASTSSSTITYAPPTALAEGNHSISASVADRAGNSGNVSGTFTVDTVAPGAAAVQGISQGQVISSSVVLTLSAEDTGSGVDTIQLLVDGSVRGTVQGPSSSLTLDINWLSEGQHTVSAVVRDRAGNSATTPAITIVVSRYPLTMSVTPATVTAVRDSVTVTAWPSKTVEHVEFRLGSETAVVTASPFQKTFDLSSFAEGEQTILVTATAAGGEQVTKSVAIVVDRTPPAAPIATLIYAAPPASGVSDVHGNHGAVEADATVRIRNTANNEVATTNVSQAGSFWASIFAGSGDTLEVSATDQAGNEGPGVAVVVRTAEEVPLPASIIGRYYGFHFYSDGSLQGTEGSFGGWEYSSERGALQLTVVRAGAEMGFAGSSSAVRELDGRQLAIPLASTGGLSISRKVFVPENGYFARYLELFSNRTPEPITIDVRIGGNVRSAEHPTQVIATSSGDGDLDVTGDAPDHWAVIGGPTDAAPHNGEYWTCPPIAVAFDGEGALERADRAELVMSAVSEAVLSYRWDQVTIPPNSTIALMHFAIQGINRQAAQASAERVVQFPPEALEGLTPEERSAIRNFAVPADGSSTLEPFRFGSVSGQLYSGDGIPVAGNVVFQSENAIYVYPQEDGNSWSERGAFLFENVVVDRFTLTGTAQSTGYTGAPVEGEFQEGELNIVRDVVLADTGSVSGVVRLYSGGIVSDGTIRIQAHNAEAYAHTDTNGRYSIAAVPSGPFQVSIENWPGGLSGTASGVVVAGQAAVADITLGISGKLTGTVHYPNGDPVPNVDVVVYSPDASFSASATTDSSGTYLFSDVAPGIWTVVARVPGTSIESPKEQLEIIADQTTIRDLTLPGLGSVRVIATNISGAPKPNFGVYLYASGVNRFATTNSSGIATFSGVPVGKFRAQGSDGYAFGVLQHEGEEVTISLVDARGTVKGTVFAGDGTTPLDADYVEVLNSLGDPDTVAGYTTWIGSDGNYRVDVRAASVTLRARHNGDYVEKPVAFTSNRETLTVNFTMPVWRGTIRGHVFQADGSTPLPGVSVRVLDPSGSRWLGSATTATDGSYEIGGVFARDFVVRAEHLEFVAESPGQFSTMDEVVTRDLSLGVISGTIHGTVYASDGVTPVPGVELALLDSAGQFAGGTKTGGSGTYQLNGVTAGAFALEVYYGADTPLVLAGALTYSGEDVVRDVILPVRASIMGVVTYGDGTPVEFPSIFAVREDTSGSTTFYAMSTYDGLFAVLDVPPGPFTLIASDGMSPLQGIVEGVVTDSPTPVVLNVVLPSGTITGTVLDANGEPAAGAALSLVSAGSPGNKLSTVADWNGSYAFERVPVGEYLLQATDAYRVVFSSRLGVLVAGEVQTVNISLPATGTLTGEVFDMDGVRRARGVPVLVDAFHDVGPEGWAQFYAQTDEYGLFRADNVPVGMARVSGEGNSTIAALGVVDVAPAQTRSTTLRFGNALRVFNGYFMETADAAGYTLGCRADVTGAMLSNSSLFLLDGSTSLFPCLTAVQNDVAGRQLIYGPVGFGDVQISRKVFVPSAENFVRHLEVIENRGIEAVTLRAGSEVHLGSYDARYLEPPSANGNTYVVFSFGSSLAAVVMAGPGAGLPMSTVFYSDSYIGQFDWSLTLQPGERVALVHFALEGTDGDLSAIRSRAEALVNLSNPYALYGLSEEEKAAIVNFEVH